MDIQVLKTAKVRFGLIAFALVCDAWNSDRLCSCRLSELC
jgi:hypothetical protein